MNELNKANAEFFTYMKNEDKFKKTMLKAAPSMDISDIVKYMKELRTLNNAYH